MCMQGRSRRPNVRVDELKCANELSEPLSDHRIISLPEITDDEICKPFPLSVTVWQIFTARRYAKHGICRRVSVCVCHTPVLYQNG